MDRRYSSSRWIRERIQDTSIILLLAFGRWPTGHSMSDVGPWRCVMITCFVSSPVFDGGASGPSFMPLSQSFWLAPRQGTHHAAAAAESTHLARGSRGGSNPARARERGSRRPKRSAGRFVLTRGRDSTSQESHLSIATVRQIDSAAN